MKAQKSGSPGFSRRSFLVSTGWLAAGSTVVFTPGCSLPVLPTMGHGIAGEDADAWMQMLPQGRVRFFMGKAEMGQGVLTGLTQIVAEELNLRPEAVSVALPSTEEIPPVAMTVGSESISGLYGPLRSASARLRESLKAAAAQKAGIPIAGLIEMSGGFRIEATGKRIGYEDIVGSDPSLERLSETPQPMPPVKPRHVGRRVPRIDVPAKVTGETVYSHDVRIPGMLHGAVARPPAFGAVIDTVESGAARRLKGVAGVVERPDEGFVGVVAESEAVARRALALIDIGWHVPKLWQQEDIDRLLDLETLKKQGETVHTIRSQGDVAQGREAARREMDRAYSTPFAAHAYMETHAGVAHVTDRRAQVWVGSQDAFFHRARTAAITGFPTTTLRCIPLCWAGASEERSASRRPLRRCAFPTR